MDSTPDWPRVEAVLTDVAGMECRHGYDDAWVCADPEAPDDPTRVRVCFWAAVGLAVAAHGGPLMLHRTKAGAGWALRAVDGGWPTVVICGWLGVAPRDFEAVEAGRLPRELRRRVQRQMRSSFVGRWPLTGLSDSGVSFELIAEALRVQLGLDREAVAS